MCVPGLWRKWNFFEHSCAWECQSMQGAPWEVRQTEAANSTRKNKKKLYVKLVAILEIEGLLAPEISKFTKIRKFQKNLYANLRLLNDYGLIISIKTCNEIRK